MKETGIIMSGNHPRLILDGLKTMTRRVIKRELPTLEELREYWGCLANKTDEELRRIRNDTWGEKCPYGQVGDRLWVREKYFVGSMTPCLQAYITFADMTTIEPFVPADAHIQERGWHPSIHLPKWASRILLEITEVRVERLQEITSEDAIAEGINPRETINPRWVYLNLWDSLNAKRGYGWETNPWVWVISFRRLNA